MMLGDDDDFDTMSKKMDDEFNKTAKKMATVAIIATIFYIGVGVTAIIGLLYLIKVWFFGGF